MQIEVGRIPYRNIEELKYQIRVIEHMANVEILLPCTRGKDENRDYIDVQ